MTTAPGTPTTPGTPDVPGLPDELYEHDGLVTKRAVRALALAHLRPREGELLWDLGAGSGSIAIEWVRACHTSTAIAVERDPLRAARATANAARLADPARLQVRVSALVEALPELRARAAPDAVFVGGGLSAQLVTSCLGALGAGGRFVAHAVTLDTEQLLVEAYREHGGALARVAVDQAEPLGRYLGWRPLRPVVQWSLVVSR
ncbi:MAG: precorrin-6Y C5,15-methyltransferase (decarboxylating) subunit CbiT [Austwickia sp.]|nr:precorrin-6Y C5,15-methyltransferase (decarboxylating) subunit CbiT [Austwickia sp.]MBK8437866.1 precorrin-6Y C5,15-methyltransferase (decarboxylating) subunit CbiT [Austwickia sp.]MBK9100167.1 precorrin-6Y C5,15-methyltransferase (decarboxylating) subunit CbiT [Austwickia sp.]